MTLFPDDRPTRHRSKRKRGPRCPGRIKWPWRDRTTSCWHRVEKGQTLCVWHRGKGGWGAHIYINEETT